MPKLHLYGGGKGGVGKSFVCRTACQYLLDKEQSFTAFDTDRSNPDFMRIYGKAANCRVAILSESARYEDAGNAIYNAATKSQVLCNLPAQILPALRLWIEENGILELAKEDDVQFVHWFVTNGSWDSIKLFKRYFSLFPEMRYIFVKNNGMTEDFSGLDEDAELAELLTVHGIPVMEFPKFHGSSTRNRIDGDSLTFAKARDRKQNFSSIDRRRVHTFLEKAYACFDELKVFEDNA